ncbi:hypothetical protein SDC9_139859 [bioreactor metagenome]|uniref:Uncharacterized protein n=1 Tax=bioreactor metagenome TaxID=1076179 RepID=A0A645DVU2_9ZZZZ
MLGGYDDRVDPHRLIAVVFHRHLGLAVRPQVSQLTAAAHFRKALCQPVRQRDGQRHQLGGLVTGKPKHHALVTCAAHVVVGAQRDVGALLVNVGDHRTSVGVEPIFCTGVTDAADRLAHNFGDIHIAGGRDLPHHVHKAGADRCLTGYAPVGVLL